jgi:DNA (cytosine-5)-methyltransferase 1
MSERAQLKFFDTPLSTIRIGTDCSGIEAPIEALSQLGIPFKHVFSSEIDKYCLNSINANYHPEILYEDITKRDNTTIPDLDLYVCGFPCQPFSNAGNRKGFEHKSGNVFWSCLDVIKTKKPKIFILENVKGLLWHNKKQTWNIIRGELEQLEDYNFQWKVLNTKDYGIPQNRERVFMIGILKTENIDFSWPEPLPMKSIAGYVDRTRTKKDTVREDVLKSGMLQRIPDNAVFVDFSFKKHNYPNSGKYCPCIAADSRLWCVPMERYATGGERLLLQGFRNLTQVVSDRQINKQIGNSMSVNVLTELFKRLYGDVN